MSKGLEALETIKNITIIPNYEENGAKRIVFASEIYKEQIDLIENALKEYEEIKSICSQYGIKFILVNVREALFTLAQLKGEYGNNWENYNKKLKALEIIKSHRPTFTNNLGMCNSKEGIRYSILINDLTQEEYELLKEVLE